MLAIPLPFAVDLVLAILWIRLAAEADGGPSSRASLVFVAACGLLAVATGLRWSCDLRVFRMARPVLAGALPPLAWLCFAAPRRRTPHLVPFLAIAGLAGLRAGPVDVALAAEFLGYGTALLVQAGGGAGALLRVVLGEREEARRAVAIVGGSLVLSGVIDLAVAADFAVAGGAHAEAIVGGANGLVLGLVTLAAAVSGQVRLVPEPPGEAEPAWAPPEPSADDAEIAAAVDRLLAETQLYRDPDLTLERLARRAGLPPRRISVALNRVYGRNVSQVINARRIAEAQRLLAETDAPVTRVQFEAGFLTKSNFNREFRRITGTSPSDYRRRLSGAGTPPGSG